MDRDENIIRNFTRAEFACHCGCGLDNMDPVIPRYLQVIRDDINSDKDWLVLDRGEFAIIINCGCRCPRHNAQIYAEMGKPPNMHSPHLPQEDGLCKAVDCKAETSLQRYFLIKHGLWWFKNMEWGTVGWIHFDIIQRASGPSIFIP